MVYPSNGILLNNEKGRNLGVQTETPETAHWVRWATHKGLCTLGIHLCGASRNGKTTEAESRPVLASGCDNNGNLLKWALGNFWELMKRTTRPCGWLNNCKFNKTPKGTHDIRRFYGKRQIPRASKNLGLFYSPSANTSYISLLFIHDQSRTFFILWSSTENSPNIAALHSSLLLSAWLVHSLTHSIIQQNYIEHLPSIKLCSRCWKCKMNKSSPNAPLFFSR